MDFMRPAWRIPKKDAPPEIYPIFITKKSKDLMIRGGDFYAIWDERKGMWSTDQDDVIDLIDAALEKYKASNANYENSRILYMWNADSGSIDKWNKYVQKQMTDNYHQLNERLIFANSPVRREDYASKRLPYALEAGDTTAWDTMIGTLYSEEERHKIEWAIGSIVNGASKELQKFFVFYGDAGTGKSTILGIIKKLFDGYCGTFDAKALGSANAAFALEPFKENPLVSIQDDADLSRIEDNTRLNSLVSHEELSVNEKYKGLYAMRFNTILFMGSNKPVKITDSKSGLMRRLIDINPSGNKIPRRQYDKLKKEIEFELGAIAWKCKEIFEANPQFYDNYRPQSMMSATNDFYNFMEYNFDKFREKDGTSLTDAWTDYKIYCEYAKIQKSYTLRPFKEELKGYFNIYRDRYHPTENEWYRNWYGGLKLEKFGLVAKEAIDAEHADAPEWLRFDKSESLFDAVAKDFPAQYAKEDGKPATYWDAVKTVLADLNTSELHYVLFPEKFWNYIVIDFDLKDENGEKSLEKNIEAASKWPETYAELSKSGSGIHLHYIYTGDVSKLQAIYSEGIEVKVFTGKSSLRRKVTRCNDIPIATISSGLPLKEEVRVVSEKVIKDEKHLRALIKKALRKEIEPYATKTSIDFIEKVLTDAHNSGMPYDVTDMRPEIMAFAGTSTHHALQCMDIAVDLPYKSDEPSVYIDAEKEEIVFFDIEIFPNLFILCIKPDGKKATSLINPSGEQIKELLKYRLVGFNNRGYDNHILYARMMGMTEFELFTISQNIINGGKGNSVRNVYMYREAYNLSYTDVYDFCAKKQSLKKWEIELGIHHLELGLPWDQPVPEDQWERVATYCINDVVATEATFHANAADFKARQILVDMANSIVGPGSCENDTTNMLTTKLIVGNEKNPQAEFVYPDLKKEFPGYEFNPFGIDKSRYMRPVEAFDIPAGNPKMDDLYECDGDGYKPTKDTEIVPGKQYYHCTMISGKSWYKGFDPGEGGFVYARHGMYGRADCYDSASHHPSSLIAENGFGPYTKNFKNLLDLRLMVKHRDLEQARSMFGGVLAKYLESDDDADALSYALKIAINSVYGLTAAHFDNRLHDPRNVDNWVAKRGALFMIDLLLEVEKRGYRVIHVKTDSIKIENPDDDIYQFVYDYGKKFGYTFEIEHKFDRLCLVNDAVYVCKYTEDKQKKAGMWDATGDQFKKESSPYVFKTLFSHEPIEFKDLCETYTVKVGLGLYLDMNENLPDVSEVEKEREKLQKKWKKTPYELTEENDIAVTTGKIIASDLDRDDFHNDFVKFCSLNEDISKGHEYKFVGKAGQFCPMKPGCGGGLLMRENNGKMAYAAGSKGYRWMESEMVKTLGLEDSIDYSYYRKLADDAKETIRQFGDFEAFVAE